MIRPILLWGEQVLEQPASVVTNISDAEALDAFHELSHLEGIIPALESAHAIAQAKKLKLSKNQIMVVNLSGRGDKDVTEVMRLMKEKQG